MANVMCSSGEGSSNGGLEFSTGRRGGGGERVVGRIPKARGGEEVLAQQRRTGATPGFAFLVPFTFLFNFSDR